MTTEIAKQLENVSLLAEENGDILSEALNLLEALWNGCLAHDDDEDLAHLARTISDAGHRLRVLAVERELVVSVPKSDQYLVPGPTLQRAAALACDADPALLEPR